MPGITRIHIISNWQEPRITEFQRPLEPAADVLLRNIFNSINMPLNDGLEVVECSKDEVEARYDFREGVDCILEFENGHRATLQEKYLDYWQDNATFEERKKSGNPGAWYTCTAQYYFVGYARKFRTAGIEEFQTWTLIDFPAIKRADANGEIDWIFKENNQDGYRGIAFRFIHFDKIPESCVVTDWQRIKDEQLTLEGF